MLFTDRQGDRDFAKDPAVVYFRQKYFMYYSTVAADTEQESFRIGIAVSEDGDSWKKVGQIPLTCSYEERGIAAPGAIVLGDRIHLFYQTYGNGVKDAICHAESEDGINFIKDRNNPVFRPTDDWCCGRAIDADVCIFRNRLFLYTATRDHSFKVQKIAAAYAELSEDGKNFGPFQQVCRSAVLSPELVWEENCIEAPACITDVGRILRTFKIKKNVEVTDNGKIII